MDISNDSSFSSSSPTLDQINTLFHRQLEQEEVLLLIEAGIKFFLYQRGQIPLPYDRLLSRSNSTTATPNLEQDSSKSIPSCSSSSSISSPSSTCPLENEEEEEETTIQRIRKLKSQRKTTQKQILLARRNLRYHQMEINAHSVLEDLFIRLRFVFLSQTCKFKSVIVFFGPSILHHKEMITFEIDPTLRKTLMPYTLNDIQSHEVDKKSQDFNTIVRSFCKSIVMSAEYLDFTEKSLRATFTHICIVLDEELPDDLKTELILIENHETILSSNNNNYNNNNNNSVQAKKNKKLLQVNLKLQETTEELSNGTFNDDDDDSIPLEGDENVKGSYFYQIPLRFKGIHVRANQL